MSARARLPDNLIDPKQRGERELVLGLHASGVLYRMHRFLASRLSDFEAECDHDGAFWLAEERVSDNHLFLLLRADIEAQGFDVPPSVIRKIVSITFRHIREKAAPQATKSQRVRIVHE